MAHELTTINGKVSMAYIGQTPWHGLGQKLTEGATMEAWQQEAGMDFEVHRSPVQFGTGDTSQTWGSKHVLFRSDNKHPLGLVSDSYQIVQPSQILGFFRDLCSDHGFVLDTAGVLNDGSRYWALAQLPLGFAIGEDKVSGFALLATSCDYSLATIGQITSVRVVCANTLRASLNAAKGAIRVSHSTKFDETKVKVDMGLVEKSWQQFEQEAKTLANRKLSRFEAVNILIDAMGDPEKPVAEQPNARPMAEIMRLFDGAALGSELPSSDGTAWGLINAATQFYDHTSGRSINNRLGSAWFGDNGRLKDDIYTRTLALAND
jgi:phage/plasmid-like protein (TIGR03299 family)